MLTFNIFTTKLTFWLPVVISKANDSILVSPMRVAILEIGGHIEMIWTLKWYVYHQITFYVSPQIIIWTRLLPF